jgi:hypothetical protein
MTRDNMKGMSLEDLVWQINAERRRHGLSAIAISTRLSSSGNGRTIEIHGGDVLLAKSTHGGALNWFLKGMLVMSGNAPAPKITGADLSKFGPGSRAISWRD